MDLIMYRNPSSVESLQYLECHHRPVLFDLYDLAGHFAAAAHGAKSCQKSQAESEGLRKGDCHFSQRNRKNAELLIADRLVISLIGWLQGLLGLTWAFLMILPIHITRYHQQVTQLPFSSCLLDILGVTWGWRVPSAENCSRQDVGGAALCLGSSC